ncbi:hypothetical protein LOK49_Contig14G00012 [Camellia lanceoleosa]|nr:hypothetical protein LOK49_Contig14G00012 [Camellia lanceoleosa]
MQYVLFFFSIGILEWSSTPCIFSLSKELREAEKAMYHYKQAGAESDPDVLTKAKNLQGMTYVDRFDDAVAAAQRAARLDSSSKEVNMVVRRTWAVAMARSNEKDKSVAYIITDEEAYEKIALHIAAAHGNVSVMEELLSECPNCWEMVNSKGQNVLHIAVDMEQKKMAIPILIETKFDDFVQLLPDLQWTMVTQAEGSEFFHELEFLNQRESYSTMENKALKQRV